MCFTEKNGKENDIIPVEKKREEAKSVLDEIPREIVYDYPEYTQSIRLMKKATAEIRGENSQIAKRHPIIDKVKPRPSKTSIRIEKPSSEPISESKPEIKKAKSFWSNLFGTAEADL